MSTLPHGECSKCHKLCITKDEWLRGPLKGKYEYLCGDCARDEERVWPLVWKHDDPR